MTEIGAVMPRCPACSEIIDEAARGHDGRPAKRRRSGHLAWAWLADQERGDGTNDARAYKTKRRLCNPERVEKGGPAEGGASSVSGNRPRMLGLRRAFAGIPAGVEVLSAQHARAWLYLSGVLDRDPESRRLYLPGVIQGLDRAHRID